MCHYGPRRVYHPGIPDEPSRFDPGGVGRCIGAAGGGGTPSEVPKTSPRPEEAEAQEAERSQDQTCGHGTDLGKTTKVFEMTPLGGWFGHRPVEVIDECQDSRLEIL